MPIIAGKTIIEIIKFIIEIIKIVVINVDAMKKKCTVLTDMTNKVKKPSKKRTYAVAFDIKTSEDYGELHCKRKLTEKAQVEKI